LDHIYETRLTLLVPVQVPQRATTGGAATITADLDWLVCDQVCLPESAGVSLSIPVSAEARPSKDAPLVREALSRLPRPLPEAKHRARVTVRADAAEFNAPHATRMEFYPGTKSVPPLDAITDCEARGDTMVVRLKQPVKSGARLEGILAVWWQGKD